MLYIMRQKLFSWGNDFTIKDEHGQDMYFVDGKAFSLGNQLSFQDMEGNELVFIRQRLLAWGPTYDVYAGGELKAVVKGAIVTLLHCSFSVDVPGPDDMEATGSLTDHEHEFRRGGSTVATVSKRWFAWTDTYGVEIAEGEDDIPVPASSVVIDMACHAKKD